MINFIVIKKNTMVATILGILSIFFLFLCINNRASFPRIPFYGSRSGKVCNHSVPEPIFHQLLETEKRNGAGTRADARFGRILTRLCGTEPRGFFLPQRFSRRD